MDCLCLTARRAARVLTRMYDDELRPSGLTATQFGLLSLLQERPGLTQAKIAEATEIEQTTLSRSLKLMVGNGWLRVARGGGGKDARFSTYELTERGGACRAEGLPLWEEAQAKMQAELGKKFEKTIKMLRRLGA
jgi:DNA-binding MarR family transcriptional regulator